MKKTVEQIDVHLKRLRSRLKRTINAIDKLERQKARKLKPSTAFARRQAEVIIAATPAKVIPPEDDVRALPWNKQRNEADEKAKAQIIAEQSAKKKAKAGGRIDKLKADKAGERIQMPLSGKAAAAKINEGL